VNWSRRRFMEAGSTAAAVSAIGGCGTQQTDGDAPTALELSGPQGDLTSGPRRTLAEPGPMVPLVPAILLSINGADDDPE
jgi:hypothetical protein